MLHMFLEVFDVLFPFEIVDFSMKLLATSSLWAPGCGGGGGPACMNELERNEKTYFKEAINGEWACYEEVGTT